jgi:hypothetical protein
MRDGSKMQDLVIVACEGKHTLEMILNETNHCDTNCQRESKCEAECVMLQAQNLSTYQNCMKECNPPVHASMLYSMSARIPQIGTPSLDFTEVSQLISSSRVVWWQKLELCGWPFLLAANHYV